MEILEPAAVARKLFVPFFKNHLVKSMYDTYKYVHTSPLPSSAIEVGLEFMWYQLEYSQSDTNRLQSKGKWYQIYLTMVP